MRARTNARSRFLLGGLASAGVLAAHVLAYVLTEPDAHARSHLLESTGHRYWSVFVAAGLAVLVAGLARFVLGALTDPRRDPGSRVLTFTFVAIRLAVLQVAGFLLLEALERTWGPQGIEQLIEEQAVAIGLLLQVVAALIGALVVVALTRTVELLLRSRSFLPEPSAPRSSRPPVLLLPRRFEPASGSGTLRGPPQAL